MFQQMLSFAAIATLCFGASFTVMSYAAYVWQRTEPTSSPVTAPVIEPAPVAATQKALSLAVPTVKPVALDASPEVATTKQRGKTKKNAKSVPQSIALQRCNLESIASQPRSRSRQKQASLA